MVFVDKRRCAALGAAVLAGLTLAACSSSGGTASGDGRSATASAVRGASSAPPAPTSAPSASARAAGTPTGDPCAVLTNGQVTAELDASDTLLAEGASKSTSWGCTWGSRTAYVALEWLDDSRFALATAEGSDRKVEPVPGIGENAVLTSFREDGRHPELVFTVQGRHYSLEAVADRRAVGAVNAPKEAAAEKILAAVAATRL
ncbi:DUF3558 family protein [Kitasatospora sp. NPDC049285]|uniref:DUF3558 family protein n=1 Tax=Kitasatospora sp. NPDC049285 TaxID=3157096 RepID=UPI00342EB56C